MTIKVISRGVCLRETHGHTGKGGTIQDEGPADAGTPHACPGLLNQIPFEAILRRLPFSLFAGLNLKEPIQPGPSRLLTRR